MSDFTPFEDRLTALIAALSPAGRRRLTTEIAKKVRQQQQQRIKSQTAPDGTPYTPRKRQPVRGKKNRVKQEMFAKLRTNRYMKVSGDDSAAAVEFTGKVQRIVRVHQSGLKDKPTRNSAAVLYPTRELLGFSDTDQQLVERIIIDHLAG
ncbi:phage virion morphogenesis protein [Enterobacter kobei]|uniref:phage virion morphogenesis protein n=1 Tax=Enterobacter cloacae complex TaxID=354276 RepID=UPI001259D761|nr:MULTISPECIES: phage virion morphogenesis protein [Enterobacter cloacae complex]MCM7357678.1 phage virion morphogenesis protein [Enterobacter hormaechei]HBK4725010.1 phage virion morphogenesis protein [Enterobacter hormaechei subsp. steigerwaltii]MCW4941863.1 phage virion morphogenesis protein [Enterobacter hormaechei subsp. xiangfangensis]VAX71208.1 Phage tail completion protein [Enterobacter kobei]HBK4820315.1 phage virion morphogenesis protein [Enterobacter hormaechei subsp. steigerwaltii